MKMVATTRKVALLPCDAWYCVCGSQHNVNSAHRL